MTVEHENYSLEKFTPAEESYLDKLFTFNSFRMRKFSGVTLTSNDKKTLLDKVDKTAGQAMRSFGLGDIRNKRRHVANILLRAKYHTNTNNLELTGGDTVRLSITGGNFKRLEGMVGPEEAKQIIRRYARYLLAFHSKTPAQSRFTNEQIEQIVLSKFIGRSSDDEIANRAGIVGERPGNSVRKLMNGLMETDLKQLGIINSIDIFNFRLKTGKVSSYETPRYF